MKFASNLLTRLVVLLAAVGVTSATAFAQSSLGPSATSGWAEVDNPYVHVYRSSGAGSETYPISANPSGILNLPSSFTLNNGQTSNYFYFSSNAVSQDTDVVVTIGALNFTYKVKAVTVTSTSASDLNPIGHSSQSYYMYVTLPCPAKTGGFTVALSSSNPAALPVPVSVNIPGGSTQNYFYFQPRDVAVDTPVVISATLNGVTKNTNFLVKPIFTQPLNPQVATLYGGALNPYIYAYLQAGPFENYVLNLSSSHPSALQPPATVTLTAGSSNNYFYVNSGLVSTPTNVTITAKSALLGAGAPARTCQILVKPNSPTSIATSQPVIYGGAGSQYHYVTLPAPPLANAVVTISSSNAGVLTGPQTLVIPAGSTNNYFYSTSAFVSQDYPVKLFATYSGNTVGVDILVKPLVVTDIQFSQNPVLGGTGSPYFYVVFPAPPLQSQTVALSSSNPAIVQVPDSVTISAGSSNNYRYYTTSTVTKPKYVDITATFNGRSYTETLCVIQNGNYTVSGRIKYNDLADPSMAPTSFDVDLREPGTINVLQTITVPIQPDGSYYFDLPAAQTYDLSYRYMTYLRKTIKNVGAGKTFADFFLINGDVDGDNTIGLFDYLILSDAFDSSIGDTNFVADADLDQDGVVSLFDYLILSNNFDLQGDE